VKKARPSGMATAEQCALSPWLAARHQFLKPEMGTGSDVDGEITASLRGGPAPKSLAAMEIVAWVRRTFPADSALFPQRHVRLEDQEMGELLSEGDADLVVVADRDVHVADWKKKGQLWAGYISSPDAHPQQLAYGLGAALELNAAAFTVHHVFFNGPDDDNIEPRSSRRYPVEEWPALLARFRAMPDVDLDGPEPPATEGEHCNTCWQQRWCSARLLPAHKGPSALEPFTKGLTPERLPEAIDVLERFDKATKLASEKAWAQVEGLVKLHGPVRAGGKEYGFFEKQGKRRPPTLDELEAAKLSHLIKPPETKVAFGSRKAPLVSHRRSEAVRPSNDGTFTGPFGSDGQCVADEDDRP
jgi:hypothetical protein